MNIWGSRLGIRFKDQVQESGINGQVQGSRSVTYKTLTVLVIAGQTFESMVIGQWTSIWYLMGCFESSPFGGDVFKRLLQRFDSNIKKLTIHSQMFWRSCRCCLYSYWWCLSGDVQIMVTTWNIGRGLTHLQVINFLWASKRRMHWKVHIWWQDYTFVLWCTFHRIFLCIRVTC